MIFPHFFFLLSFHVISNSSQGSMWKTWRRCEDVTGKKTASVNRWILKSVGCDNKLEFLFFRECSPLRRGPVSSSTSLQPQWQNLTSSRNLAAHMLFYSQTAATLKSAFLQTGRRHRGLFLHAASARRERYISITWLIECFPECSGRQSQRIRRAASQVVHPPLVSHEAPPRPRRERRTGCRYWGRQVALPWILAGLCHKTQGWKSTDSLSILFSFHLHIRSHLLEHICESPLSTKRLGRQI